MYWSAHALVVQAHVVRMRQHMLVSALQQFKEEHDLSDGLGTTYQKITKKSGKMKDHKNGTNLLETRNLALNLNFRGFSETKTRPKVKTCELFEFVKKVSGEPCRL